MDPSSEPKVIISRFEKLLAKLVASGVDFAVVGGLAVVLNGYPRMTIDADILVQDAPDNLRKLLACLAGWGEGWARELKPEDFSAEEGCVRVADEFELDIFTRMMGKSLDDFRPRLRHEKTTGANIPYLAPEDLVFLKKDSWREKDKMDVAAMREILDREGRRE